MADDTRRTAYTTAHIDDLPVEIDDERPTTEWKPVRRFFGIGSFGTNLARATQPGDVLKVTLNKIVPRAYATNFNVPGMFGQFPSVYSDGQVKYMYLDLDKMTTEFLPGIVLRTPDQAVPRYDRRCAQGARTLLERAAR